MSCRTSQWCFEEYCNDFIRGAAVRIVSMVRAMSTRINKYAASAWALIACGLWLTALGLYFIFIRPALLPEDLDRKSVV